MITNEEIENEVKRLSKLSTAPDKDTPDWMESDIRNGIKAGILLQQNKVSDDPATEQSTANWGKVTDKDEFLDEVRGREKESAIDVFKNHGVHYYEGDEDEIIAAMEEYASIVKERDNVVNDFADRYEGYCPKCHKVIKTNMQGNELGTHICIPQKEQVNDAVEFAEWCAANAWQYDFREQKEFSLEELYKIFHESQPK